MVIADGSTASADEVLEITKIKQVYASTGFDSSQTGAGTDTQDHELTAIVAADLINANYVEISVTGEFVTTGARGGHKVSLKVQTKEIGGSYSDSTGYQTIVYQNGTAGGYNDKNDIRLTWKWVHTLTAGEKSNGVQVKLFSQSYVDNDGGGSTGQLASFTNIQDIEEIKS